MKCAVVGAAITPVRIYGPEVTDVGLAAAALKEALADSGLDRSDIDGLTWNLGRPSGENYPQTVEATGLEVRFLNQSWTHGRFTGSTVSQAAMAIAEGEANVVACIGGVKRAGAWPSPSGARARGIRGSRSRDASWSIVATPRRPTPTRRARSRSPMKTACSTSSGARASALCASRRSRS